MRSGQKATSMASVPASPDEYDVRPAPTKPKSRSPSMHTLPEDGFWLLELSTAHGLGYSGRRRRYDHLERSTDDW